MQQMLKLLESPSIQLEKEEEGVLLEVLCEVGKMWKDSRFVSDMLVLKEDENQCSMRVSIIKQIQK